MTGSTDGLLNVFNTSLSDEDDALHQTINHGHSIHRANFLSKTDIFALSHDEHFSTYQLISNPEQDADDQLLKDHGDMRSSLGAEYVTNVLPRPDGGAVMGIGRHSERAFDLVHLKSSETARGWAFEPESRVSLAGAHGDSIVRSFCFHDEVSNLQFATIALNLVN